LLGLAGITEHALAKGKPLGGGDGGKNDIEITLIHIGDIHGHLIPRPNLRSDGTGRLEGGLARMYTQIKNIRDSRDNTLLINTGDTTQGSAEALYTRGQALVDVMNLFDIDYFAPGNWDFVYGTERFHELFVGENPAAPWNSLAANLYYDGYPYADKTGERVLPPYAIKTIDGVKIGILGFTTERGPKVIGAEVVEGFRFTKGDAEVAEFVTVLTEQENVDLILMISELGLANNIRLAEANPGIDILLSSDMHEETPEPVITSTGTLVIEMGQDGTRVGELTLKLRKGEVVEKDFTMHVIDERIKENKSVARKVAEVRKPFVAGKGFKTHTNPINGTKLTKPIDSVIGYASIGLHRSNFTQEDTPAVIEGSSHDFLTDVFRVMGNADLGVIRGFRYGTHISAGPIKLEDIFHYIPIGPFIARGEVSGQQIKNILENSADGSLNPDVSKWRGGWLFGWSGISFDLDPYATLGQRISNVRVLDSETGVMAPLDLAATYTLAGYNYDSEPNLINKAPAQNVVQVTDEKGKAIDATEVVAEYLKDHDADPDLNRIRLLSPLPAPVYGNPELQPLQGASR
jgi:sulfur-oxidizing protein SoxB